MARKTSYRERPHRAGSKHLGYKALEAKIARNERKAHPTYSKQRIDYIAHAAAGEIANERSKRGF
jgi:hypothetical protein